MAHEQELIQAAGSPDSKVSVAAGLLALQRAVLLSYSRILFAEDARIGVPLLLATFVDPRLGAFGLSAILCSFLVVKLGHFSEESAAEGIYGYNPLLVGLALGAFIDPGLMPLVLLPVAVIAVVFLQTALETALSYHFNLPVLSLPFVIVTFFLLAAAPFIQGVSTTQLLEIWDPQEILLPPAIDLYLRSLGAIFFEPNPITGALVTAALLVFSRVAFLLSLLGFVIGWFLLNFVFAFQTQLLALIVGFNFILTAIALGGIWFVPQRSSFVFAGIGTLLSALSVASMVLFMTPLRLPVLILPFNLTLILILYAMRQRVRDEAPRSVDVAVGSPEANLAYFRTRIARFGARYLARFSLPVAGKWTVTQGIDGEHTHRGSWRHACDLEVMDATGAKHKGSGGQLEDYYAYRLPVLAVADGTVVKIVNDIPDNTPGEHNPRENWGNLVIIIHGVGLYSLVCHLAPGSVEVAEGMFVRKGARLGACGNSGRSFVPHVHVHLQATPRVGSPTLPLEFHDVILEAGNDLAERIEGVQDTTSTGQRLDRVLVPAEGMTLRNVLPAEDIAEAVRIRVGTRLTFALTSPDGSSRDEVVEARIDLMNRLYLSPRGGPSGDPDPLTRLWYENQAHQYIVYRHEGERDSALYLFYAALSRMPFEDSAGLCWDDVLLAGAFRSPWTAWLHDLMDPFRPGDGLTLQYRQTVEDGQLVVLGEGSLESKAIRTRAVIDLQRGVVALELVHGDRKTTARLLDESRYEG